MASYVVKKLFVIRQNHIKSNKIIIISGTIFQLVVIPSQFKLFFLKKYFYIFTLLVLFKKIILYDI